MTNWRVILVIFYKRNVINDAPDTDSSKQSRQIFQVIGALKTLARSVWHVLYKHFKIHIKYLVLFVKLKNDQISQGFFMIICMIPMILLWADDKKLCFVCLFVCSFLFFFCTFLLCWCTITYKNHPSISKPSQHTMSLQRPHKISYIQITL